MAPSADGSFQRLMFSVQDGSCGLNGSLTMGATFALELCTLALMKDMSEGAPTPFFACARVMSNWRTVSHRSTSGA